MMRPTMEKAPTSTASMAAKVAYSDALPPARGATDVATRSASAPSGPNARALRLGLVCGYACPPQPELRPAPPERHIEAKHPGHRVQMDCFVHRRLSGTQGVVPQYCAVVKFILFGR
jgi:hypothetical protein